MLTTDKKTNPAALLLPTCPHLSSTSWNTQLGVCVVVKIRLSGGILGAMEREEGKNWIGQTKKENGDH